MKEYKIFSFDEIVDQIPLSDEEWNRVRSVPYEERSEAIRREQHWPEGFLEQFKGKTLEEQMGYYRIVESRCYSSTAYGEITKENKTGFGYALENYPDLTALIVEDGVLIGVCIYTAFKKYNYGTPMFPYVNLCTYYASDNNGSGYKDREDYAHLCCVIPE